MKRALAYVVMLCAAFLFMNSPSAAQPEHDPNLIIGVVARINEGDAIVITDDKNKPVRVRLAYIDAPDMDAETKVSQPMRKESIETLAKMIMGKEVIVESLGVDKTGKIDGMVFLNQTNVNVEMVRKGMAEIYNPMRRKPAAYNKEYMDQLFAAEDAAKKEKAGIWGNPKYVSPYDLRHGKQN